MVCQNVTLKTSLRGMHHIRDDSAFSFLSLCPQINGLRCDTLAYDRKRHDAHRVTSNLNIAVIIINLANVLIDLVETLFTNYFFVILTFKGIFKPVGRTS